MQMALLDQIKSPADLKKLAPDRLPLLAAEIRRFLIDSVSKTGGHLASSLGAVELTIALHRVFSTPADKIIWDVGHQSYAHKILTGRKDRFQTLRQYGGLSGFPRSAESRHDAFDAGHASNSISAALGYACARDLQGGTNSVIAVIGDGALTGGLAYEGINNVSQLKTNLIVILNDNQMSIAPNVGGMSVHLNRLRTNPRYMQTKESAKNVLRMVPYAGKHISRMISTFKDSVRHLLIHASIFDELGFTCIGPVNGHNIDELTEVLKRAKNIRGPVMIHVYTKKGKGYTFAERNPNKFHGVGRFNRNTGEILPSDTPAVSLSNVFGKKLVQLAEQNPHIAAITAAMPDGTGLTEFARRFPNRFYDAGIAEGHAVTFAGGLAKGGVTPVVAIYSTFLQRAYDEIFHDCLLQQAHVVLAIDRAGLVGPDGETHHGVFDIAYLSHLPGMSILAPSSSVQLEEMLEYAVNKHKGVIAIRYPKALYHDLPPAEPFAFGKAAVVQQGSSVTLAAAGNMLATALEAAKQSGKSVEVIDVRTIKPLDVETLRASVQKTGRLVTLEDHAVIGGMGSLAEAALGIPVLKLGCQDRFVPHGSVRELHQQCGIDAASVAAVL